MQSGGKILGHGNDPPEMDIFSNRLCHLCLRICGVGVPHFETRPDGLMDCDWPLGGLG